MALLTAKTVENLNFKFFQLRKLAVTGALDTNVINNLAISHAHQVIFAAYGNALKAIRIATLLDYQWDKKLVDSVIASYPALEVKLPYKPLLLSVCGGTNNTLLVFGQNASNNLSGDIFDIPTLLSGNPNPVSRLEFPPAISQNVYIQSVAWHPEFAETLFAATTSNGALVTIGIDQQTRGVQLLSHYTDSFGFTCVSWSPKGKQLVVGGDNGQLTQFKHSNGKGFQKAKAIPAPASMASHKIVNVNWVHSALFQVVYVHKSATDNPDTKVVFIHAPPKVTPEYHNFGNVCMDTKQYEGPDKIRFTFSEIGNVLLCLSSLSNEVSVIGCETTEINPSPATWQQWSLDDASRIELSGVDGSDAYPVGIAWFKGPTKVFKVNDSVSLGGQGWPLIAVLSSNGLLTPYYAYHLQGKFSIPEFPVSQPLPISVPGPVRANRPDVQATGQQQQQQPQQQQPTAQSSLVKSPAQTFPAQQSQPVDASFTFSLPKSGQDEPKPQTSVTVTATVQTPVQQQQQQLFLQQQQQAAQKNQSIQSQQQQQQQQPQDQVPSKPAISEEELRKKELEVMEETFALAINEEIIEFTKTFENARNNFSKAFNIQIGKPDELAILQSETTSLFELLRTSSDTLKCLDINMLDGYILETWAMFQEATTRLEKESDPVYTLLSNRRSIDPITARKMREIKRMAHEIEMYLEDLNGMLDREWEDYTAHMDAKRLPSGVSSIDMIYHTLSNHHKTIEMLKKSLSKYDVYLESIELEKADLTLPKQKEIQDIINSLKNTSIREDNNSILDFSHKSMIKVPTITKEKKEKLLEFFEQRNSVPIRRAILPVDLKSSKMVSAVVKAQERLKEIRVKSQVNELQSKTSSSWNNQTPNQPKMVDTNPRVMPNQVTPTKSSERPDFDKSLFYTTAVGDMSSLNDTTRYQSPVKNLNFLSPITSKTDPRLASKSQSSDKSLFKEPEPADKSTPFVNKSESKDESFSLSFSSTTLGNIASPNPSSSTFLFGPSSSVKPSEKGFASTFATATKDISIISKDKDTPTSKENIKPKVESKETITNTVPSTVTTITPVSSTVPASKATAFPAFTFSQFTSSTATSAPVFSFTSTSTTAISTQPTTIPSSSEVRVTSSSGTSVPSTVTTITPVASSVVSPKPAAFPAFTFDTNQSSNSNSTSAPVFSFTSTATATATATAAAATSATPQTTTNILTSQSGASVSSNTSVSSTVTTITPVSSSVLSPKPAAFAAFTFDKTQSTTSTTATTTTAAPAFSFMPTTTALPSQSTTTVPTSSSEAVAASNTGVSSTTPAAAPVSKANVTNSSFSFSAPPSGFSFSGTTTNASSLFGSTTPSVTQSANDSKVTNSTSLFSIEKPANTTGLSFSDATASTQSFNFNSTLASLGGQPTPNSTTTNPFGTSITNPAPQLNLFSPATTAQPSTFGSPPSMSSSFASQGPGVAQTGFGSFSAQNQPRFGAQPTFGGAPAFGNQPTFGGSPTFGTALPFGKTPSNSNLGFGQPAAVATVTPQPVQPTGQPSPFGGFANANTPSFGALASQQAPTFGQLAASTQQQPVVQPQQQPATGSLFGGFGGQPAPIPTSSSIFGNSFPQAPAFGSPQFSQRRQ